MRGQKNKPCVSVERGLFIDYFSFYLESLSLLFAEIKIICLFKINSLVCGSIPSGPVSLEAAFYAENFDVSHVQIGSREVC